MKKLKEFSQIIVLTVLVLGVTAIGVLWQFRASDILDKTEKLRIQEIVALRTEQVNHYFFNVLKTVESIALVPNVRIGSRSKNFTKDDTDLIKQLGRIAVIENGIHEIYITYRNEESRPFRFISVGEKDLFERVTIKEHDKHELDSIVKHLHQFLGAGNTSSLKRGIISDDFISSENHLVKGNTFDGLVYSVPIRDVQGAIIGVVSATLKQEIILKKIKEDFFFLQRGNNIWGKRPIDILKRRTEEETFVYQSSILNIEDMGQWELIAYVTKDDVARTSMSKVVYEGALRFLFVVLSLGSILAIHFYFYKNYLRLREVYHSMQFEVNRRKDYEVKIEQFTADAAHELRSPIAILRGEIEVALRKERTSEHLVEVIQRNLIQVDRLQGIINALLDLAHIEQLEDRPLKKIDFKKLVQSRISEMSPKIPSGFVVENHLLDGVDLFGDEFKLSQLIDNIVGNAIKYRRGETGSLVIYCTNNQTTNEILFHDYGLGIGQEDLPFVFDRFFRSDKVRTIGKEGMGLGLSICKKIVDFHGGTISVDSKKGVETTIKLTFPKIQIV